MKPKESANLLLALVKRGQKEHLEHCIEMLRKYDRETFEQEREVLYNLRYK